MYNAKLISVKELQSYLNEAKIKFNLNAADDAVAVIKISPSEVMLYEGDLNTIKDAVINLITNSYLSYEGFYVVANMELSQ